jgi:DNA-binding LacI/PurR family transcriptional regulator
MSKINIDQVARYAFVSRSVVSRVLNNHPHVSDVARERVLNVIKKYNYQRNSAARSLAAKNTREVGILSTRNPNDVMSNGFSTLLYLGVFEECLAQRYSVRQMFISTEMKEEFQKFILNEHTLDGVILFAEEVTDLLAEELLFREIPAVLIGHAPGFSSISSVDVDNFAGSYSAVTHLVRLGHRNIGAMVGSQLLQESQDRLAGYRNALVDAGVPVNEAYVTVGGYTQKSGHDKMLSRIKRQPEVTAWFCASDTMAMGALSALHKSGQRVPDDVAVVGFDDLSFARYTIPPLTTIRQPIYQKGRYAARMLIDLINGKQTDIEHRNLKPDLVVRESCGHHSGMRHKGGHAP